MTITQMSDIIRRTMDYIAQFFAPFMELPPDEYSFCAPFSQVLERNLDHWLIEQKNDYETFPFMVEIGVEYLKIKDFKFERYLITIKERYPIKTWLFLKINIAPTKINLLKWDLKQANLQLEANVQKYELVGILVADLPKNGVPVCHFSRKIPGERFMLKGNTMTEILGNNKFIRIEAPVPKEAQGEFGYTLKEPAEIEIPSTTEEKEDYLLIESAKKFLAGKKYLYLSYLSRSILNHLLLFTFNFERFNLNNSTETWNIALKHGPEIYLTNGNLLDEYYLMIYRLINETNTADSVIHQRKENVSTVRWRILFQDSMEQINSVFPLLNGDLETGQVKGACALILGWPNNFFLGKWGKNKFKMEYGTKKALKEDFERINVVKEEKIVLKIKLITKVVLFSSGFGLYSFLFYKDNSHYTQGKDCKGSRGITRNGS